MWFKSLGFCCISEGGAIADCTKSPPAPKRFFADLCQDGHLPTTYGILLLHRRCYRSLYGLEGDADPPAASAGGWPGCPVEAWMYIAKEKTGEARQRIGKRRLPRRNRLRHHRQCIRTLAKWRRWSQGRNTVKHLSQLHAQRKIYLAAKSSCVCANSPSHGMDGCHVTAREKGPRRRPAARPRVETS